MVKKAQSSKQLNDILLQHCEDNSQVSNKSDIQSTSIKRG